MKPTMIQGSGNSHLNGNRTNVMKFLGQESLTKVTEKSWG